MKNATIFYQFYKTVNRRSRLLKSNIVYKGLIGIILATSSQLETIIERRRKKYHLTGGLRWLLSDLVNATSIYNWMNCTTAADCEGRTFLLDTFFFPYFFLLYFTVLRFWHYVPSSFSKFSLFQ